MISFITDHTGKITLMFNGRIYQIPSTHRYYDKITVTLNAVNSLDRAGLSGAPRLVQADYLEERGLPKAADILRELAKYNAHGSFYLSDELLDMLVDPAWT